MFLQPNPLNFHVMYPNTNRHWSPRSEAYAGGDSLLTAIQRGWQISNAVVRERYWHAGSRCVSIYHFRLRKGDREITMPVLENPYVTRMLFISPFDVIEADENWHADTQEQQVS